MQFYLKWHGSLVDPGHSWTINCMQCCQLSNFVTRFSNFSDPYSDFFSKKRLATYVATFWMDLNSSPWRESPVFLSKREVMCYGLWIDCSVGGTEQQHVQWTNHQPDRVMNELWMCEPNDQSLILTVFILILKVSLCQNRTLTIVNLFQCMIISLFMILHKTVF